VLFLLPVLSISFSCSLGACVYAEDCEQSFFVVSGMPFFFLPLPLLAACRFVCVAAPLYRCVRKEQKETQGGGRGGWLLFRLSISLPLSVYVCQRCFRCYLLRLIFFERKRWHYVDRNRFTPLILFMERGSVSVFDATPSDQDNQVMKRESTFGQRETAEEEHLHLRAETLPYLSHTFRRSFLFG
jgi:hypothetical protein